MCLNNSKIKMTIHSYSMLGLLMWCLTNVSTNSTVHSFDSTRLRRFLLDVDSDQSLVTEVDSKYLSFTFDSHQLVQGWKSINLTNKQFISLVKHLHPAYLRVGGTDADIIQFVDEYPLGSGLPQSVKEVINLTCSAEHRHQDEKYKRSSNVVAYVPAKHILALGNFVAKTKVELIYDLNALLRTKNKNGTQWDATNTKQLMEFMLTNGIRVFGWELGNEPDSFRHVFNVTVAAPQLAKDFAVLKNLTKTLSVFDRVRIIGPDVTRPTGTRSRSSRYLRAFLKNGGGKIVDKVTFHQYYFDGREAVLNDFIDVDIMNNLSKEIARAVAAVKKFAPGKPLWIGETGSGWGGGCKNISDRYASSFLWLDKLGLSARSGIDVVFRQSLMGGAYGLLDLDANPTPDYYISVLYKRLVGARVVAAGLVPLDSHTLIPREIRLYFHCTHYLSGGLTIFGLNVGNFDAEVVIPGLPGKIIHEYLIQAPQLNSRFSYLNNVILRLNANGTLPVLEPLKSRALFTIPSLSMGFWVLPRANITTCRGR